jgi:DNA-binding XRE family transcriptional regulator
MNSTWRELRNGPHDNNNMVIEISALTTSANRQKEEIQHQRTKEKIEPKLKLNKEVCLKFWTRVWVVFWQLRIEFNGTMINSSPQIKELYFL